MAVMPPPGTETVALAPFTIPVAEVKSEMTFEQLETVQTRNVIWPVLFASVSLKDARRDGVSVASDAATRNDAYSATVRTRCAIRKSSKVSFIECAV